MTHATSKTFVVVYQFGKVASTALVEALNEQPGIEAVQSHFLGDAALHSIMESCLDPTINDHFFFHQSGQLFKNLQVTHRIKRVLSGNETDTRLVVLSTVREPLDWLRSAITQDINGYADSLREAAKRHAIPGEEIEELTQPALTAILGELADLIEGLGSIDAYLRSPAADQSQILQCVNEAKIGRLFSVTIRPFGWHRNFLEPVFDCKLDDFHQEGDIFSFQGSRFDAHLYRYEDVEVAVPQVAAKIGLDESFKLNSRNVSEGKILDEEVRAAFKSDASRRLAKIFAATEYSQRFRYSS